MRIVVKTLMNQSKERHYNVSRISGARSGPACRINIASMTLTKTWMDPGLGPVTSRRGLMTRLAIENGLASDVAAMIMFPSLLRSLWSFFLHIRVRPSSISTTSWSSSSFLPAICPRLAWIFPYPSSQNLVPKLSPNWWVIGALVKNQVFSTQSSLAENIKQVDIASDSLAWRSSSITRRFHRICKKGDTSFIGQQQMGTRLKGDFSQEQGFQEFNSNFLWTRSFTLSVNTAKKWE